MESVFGFLTSLFWFVVVIVVVLSLIALKSYNRLQALAQNLREAASNTEVAISKKLSLINQLIDLVRNHQEFEQFTHLKLSSDNAEMMSKAWAQAGQVLTAIQGMAQRFPELRTSGQYDNLAHSIQASEQGISDARERYNANVRTYNTARASIPTVFVARYMGFSEAPFLEFDHSGVMQVNTLRDFKTGDSERLQQLLQNTGNKIAEGTKALASSTVQAGRALQERLQDLTQVVPDDAAAAEAPRNFFHMMPGGTPQGPVSLEQLQAMFAGGEITEATQVAPAGSASWQPIREYL
ncbi:MAG: LemA family protein [Betaproteobacteria bacterium]|nr:LemA family protein [Betaproteobacteria bacterium]MCL2886107.1 LemA family protein [Betaproteobacteria bacterium]